MATHQSRTRGHRSPAPAALETSELGADERAHWEGQVPALLALACGLAAAWIVVIAVLSARVLGWV